MKWKPDCGVYCEPDAGFSCRCVDELALKICLHRMQSLAD